MKYMLPVVALLLGLVPASGIFIRPELTDVPLERLVANLTERAEKESMNAEALHQLARTHAMAYSRKLGEADAVKTVRGRRAPNPVLPWFGHQPPHVPFSAVTETDDEKKIAAAKAHLATAIATYRKALAAKPDDSTIKLGLAWCQDQAGDKASAITGYRAVAAAAWERESKQGGGFGNFLFVETGGYLKALLDADEDADEIADIDEKSKKLLALPRAVTPLIIPVSDRIELEALVDRDARVPFDLDGSGRQLEWPWITPDAAWLVHDPRATGRITSSIQMFGSRTFLLFCEDGYQALALLDDDENGELRGAELDGLALWRDVNGDGISDAGEVRPVVRYGIRALSTRSTTHATGIPWAPAGVTLEDGATRPTYDLVLESKVVK